MSSTRQTSGPAPSSCRTICWRWTQKSGRGTGRGGLGAWFGKGRLGKGPGWASAQFLRILPPGGDAREKVGGVGRKLRLGRPPQGVAARERLQKPHAPSDATKPPPQPTRHPRASQAPHPPPHTRSLSLPSRHPPGRPSPRGRRCGTWCPSSSTAAASRMTLTSCSWTRSRRSSSTLGCCRRAGGGREGWGPQGA